MDSPSSDTDTSIDIPPNPNHPHPDTTSPHPRLLLTLTSYSHRRGPLLSPPTAGLSFDIRALPNVPRRLRAVCVGTDKALRKAFMEEGACRERVGAIEEAVRGALGGVEEGEREGEREGVNVRVGVCCEMGRHRSVACVEELARVEWPSGWEVEVVHRDLTKHRSERDKEKRARRVEREEGEDSE